MWHTKACAWCQHNPTKEMYSNFQGGSQWEHVQQMLKAVTICSIIVVISLQLWSLNKNFHVSCELAAGIIHPEKGFENSLEKDSILQSHKLQLCERWKWKWLDVYFLTKLYPTYAYRYVKILCCTQKKLTITKKARRQRSITYSTPPALRLRNVDEKETSKGTVKDSPFTDLKVDIVQCQSAPHLTKQYEQPTHNKTIG